MVKEGFFKKENRYMLLIADTISELITKMEDYTPTKIGNVVDVTVR